MPGIRYYTVTQEREVKVAANSAAGAARIADCKFRDVEYPPDVYGQALTPVRVRNIFAREDSLHA